MIFFLGFGKKYIFYHDIYFIYKTVLLPCPRCSPAHAADLLPRDETVESDSYEAFLRIYRHYYGFLIFRVDTLQQCQIKA